MTEVTSLPERRELAIKRFTETGLPTRRVEDWKYTDFRAPLKNADIAKAGTAKWQIEQKPEGIEIVDLSAEELPKWVSHHFGALTSKSALANASLGYAGGGFAVLVPENLRAGTLSVKISGSGHIRILLMAERSSHITFVETHAGDAGEIRNVGTEIFTCPDAEIDHIRIGADQPTAIVNESIEAKQHDASVYRAHFASFGGKLARVEVHSHLIGEATQTHLSGATVLAAGRHSDVTTHMEHDGASNSTQIFKYVVGAKARAVYQGRITVLPGADGVDSRQTAKAILLDERGEADLKPELLIFAEDVKCAHGAAVGDLDDDALFYLKSRGLSDAEARDLLLRAFLSEAVDEIRDEDIRSEVWQAVETALRSDLEAVE